MKIKKYSHKDMRKIIMASNGKIFDTVTSAVKFMKDSGLHIVAATEKAKNIHHSARFDTPLAIILGSEEKGISEKLLELADERIKIPLKGKIESLNVSVTAGILLYEVIRQRTQ
jgi:23S rRNA (guanosine2251-2'-O)-methyltransferase